MDKITKYQQLYNLLNFDYDYKITHKKLKLAIKIINKKFIKLKNDNAFDKDIKNIYDYFDRLNCDELIDVFMSQSL